MRQNRTAVMFAGQGVLDPVVSKRVPDLDRRIYLASIAAYVRMQTVGFTPQVLIGHGFGEIAAWVAGGAFSVFEGAEIVAARSEAFANSTSPRYGMAVLRAPQRQVNTLLLMLSPEAVALAAENSPQESVIVGPVPALAVARELAAALDVPFCLLNTARAAHHPAMNAHKAAIKSKLAHLVQRPLQIPVFSPLLGRHYRADDDLVDCLAEQLCAPIRFAAAIQRLVSVDVTSIVECGPLRGLASTIDCDTISDIEICRPLSATRIAA